MITDELVQAAGLTHNESKIYLCLNQHTGLSATEVTKKTGIHRRNVYDALNRLLEKGLVNETLVNTSKKFNAVHPSHLLRLAEEQQQIIKKIVPKLKEQYQVENLKNYVKLYQGIKGVKASFTDSLRMLNEDDSCYVLGCVDMKKFLGPFIDDHHKERQKKNIKTWQLYNANFKKRAESFSKGKKYKTRILPKDFYLPVQTVVFGENIVCQILIHDEPFVIQTVDKTFAANHIKNFKMIWNMSRKIK